MCKLRVPQLSEIIKTVSPSSHKHPKCKGTYDAFNGDYDCEYMPSFACEDCKYGNNGGRKDPEAKCNQ